VQSRRITQLHNCTNLQPHCYTYGTRTAKPKPLVSLGVPKESALKYEAEIKADKFVLVVHGTAEELERARVILADTSPISIEKREVAAA
jgi:hypothetical protein